jgi:RNA polymerase sigma-70 factor (ECF subfamily)
VKKAARLWNAPVAAASMAATGGKIDVENLLAREADPPADRGSGSQMGLLVMHLDAAYRLARWLLRDETEAEDAVQEAYLRAFRNFHSLRGGDSRAWLLAIVRNGCYDRLKRGAVYRHSAFEEQTHACDRFLNQELALLHREKTEQISRALENLPANLREVLVLREFEEMSYTQIATVADIPIGTVMSRLNRARHQLKQMVSFDGEAKEIL